MKTKVLYAPDNAAGAEPNVENETIRSKPLIPRKDHDFGELCVHISGIWEKTPNLSLLFLTQSEFEALTNAFVNTLRSRRKDGSERSPLTTQLEQADADLERGIRNIKTYLTDKYEKNAPGYYSLFGIEKYGKRWRLPYDRTKRKENFQLIIGALQAEGMGNRTYGTAFWTELSSRYERLLTSATGKDGKVSVQVSSKNHLKEQLSTALSCIVFLLRANYPYTFQGELRNWGFQKNTF